MFWSTNEKKWGCGRSKIISSSKTQLTSKLDKLKKAIHVTRSLDVVSKSRKSPSQGVKSVWTQLTISISSAWLTYAIEQNFNFDWTKLIKNFAKTFLDISSIWWWTAVVSFLGRNPQRSSFHIELNFSSSKWYPEIRFCFSWLQTTLVDFVTRKTSNEES